MHKSLNDASRKTRIPHQQSEVVFEEESILKPALFFILALITCVTTTLAAFSPTMLECVAPAGTGGAWDFTCRAVMKTMLELKLVPESKTTNRAGNGGGLAFSSIATDRNAEANLLVAASTSTTMRLAQNRFSPSTENDVRWLAAIAADYGVIVVRINSPWKSLKTLLEALKVNPERIIFGGGSAIGGQDHIKVLLLARAAKIEPSKIRYQAFDGGGQALEALKRGEVQVFPGDASEVGALLETGTLRALAVQSPRRLDGVFAKIPTVRELGLNAEWVIWRGFYVPKNMPSEAYDYWVNALRRVERSNEWAKVRQQNHFGQFWMAGPEFEVFIGRQVNTLRTLSKEFGLMP
jgi:putative tricarboxylic transport membrane protein